MKFRIAAELLATCAWLGVAAGPSLSAQTFTIKQLLSAPFPTQLTASRTGETIAWVFAERGAQNVWVANGPAFKPRQVTHYTGDNGQSIASLRLSPDGTQVLFARGTELNEQGRSANPLSEPKQPKQQVFIASLAAGQPRLLGDMGCEVEGCEDIEVSPDARWAVWETKHQLWIAPLHETAKATQLTDIRGSVASPQWSPDGKHLVAIVGRQDHSFTAVLDLEEGVLHQVHYIAPSTDRNLSPRWSPDGIHLAFLRIGGVEEHRPLIPREPVPWSLWVADAHTYAAAPIWKSGKTLRDSLPPTGPDQLLFAADSTIVFGSEADGRNHLYSIRDSGGPTSPLTHGDFDVMEATLTPDKRSVLITSNQDDVDRRHTWKVAVAGGAAPVALAMGDTIEWSPVMTGDGKETLCLGSTAITPALVYKLDHGRRDLITQHALPVDFPSAALVHPKQVIFKSADGYAVHGQLFEPKGPVKRGPAVIFTHGGPSRQMLLGFHPIDFYSDAYGLNQYLASRGFTVLSVNYRLGIMYGRDFREAPNTIWRGAAEYNDVLAGAHYLQSLPTVDSKRIGLWGGSYGGFLTALGLARNSDIFAAGVDFSGVHDWTRDITDWEEGIATAPDLPEVDKLSFASSPNASISTWKSPVLLIQGDDDRNVRFNQTVSLAQKLRRQGVPFEEIVYPDEVHDFLLWKSFVDSFSATAAFFEKYLGEK